MFKKALVFLMIPVLLACVPSALAGGASVIVSLGDSYSSGEGIEPFYGQEADMAARCQDPDWLGHRSEKSWPGALTLPAVDGPMRDHRGENWFFAAVSGAAAPDLFLLSEEETAAGMTAVRERKYSRDGVSGVGRIPPQLDVFDEPFAPLMIVEVEFPSMDAASSFIPPEWFGEEVTHDRRFKNAIMAIDPSFDPMAML